MNYIIIKKIVNKEFWFVLMSEKLDITKIVEAINESERIILPNQN